MARVNVEQKAFTDDRFNRLAAAIDTDKWGAIGRMTLVWNTCQERGKHTLSRETVDAIHTDIQNLTDVLISCELARETVRGIYIAGAKERTGWLSKARKNGKLGGRPKSNQTVSREKPSGSAGANPPAPSPPHAPAHTPAQRLEAKRAPRANGQPPLSEREWQIETRKVHAWVEKHRRKHAPGDDEWETDFSATFGRSYEDWLELNERCREFFKPTADAPSSPATETL